MKIIDRLFPDYARLASVEAEAHRLRDENVKLAKSLSEQTIALKDAQLVISKKQADLEHAREQLREQTDADLLLVSARISITVLRGEKPKTSDLALQQQLGLQRQSLSNLGLGGIDNLGSLFGTVFGPH